MTDKTSTLTFPYWEESWEVHAHGGLYNISRNVLFLSDLHLGKVQHFRKHGLSIPLQVEQENLNRLDEIISFYKPNHVYLLGDLFHSDYNVQWEHFRAFLADYPAAFFTLVLGNHDILERNQYAHPALILKETFILDEKMILSHYPIDEFPENQFNMAGHIHPAVRIKGLGKQSMRLPVFWIQKNQIVLPSFGLFTGSHVINPNKDDLVFGLADDEVFRLQ